MLEITVYRYGRPFFFRFVGCKYLETPSMTVHLACLEVSADIVGTNKGDGNESGLNHLIQQLGRLVVGNPF